MKILDEEISADVPWYEDGGCVFLSLCVQVDEVLRQVVKETVESALVLRREAPALRLSYGLHHLVGDGSEGIDAPENIAEIRGIICGIRTVLLTDCCRQRGHHLGN